MKTSFMISLLAASVAIAAAINGLSRMVAGTGLMVQPPESRFDHVPPARWYAGIPNNVRILYGTFQRTAFPWGKKEMRIHAWGQLCFDSAASNAAAYHMWNNGMRTGWKFVAWRCEMDSSPVAGGKLSGLAEVDFSFEKYGLRPR